MTRQSIAFLFLGISMLVSGCIPLESAKVGPSELNQKEVISAVAVGKTTRSEVVTQLGQPDNRSSDNRLHLYSDGQWEFIPLAIFINAWPVVEGSSHFLVTYSKNGRVQDARPVSAPKYYCRANGRCLVSFDNLDLYLAGPAERAAALQFRPVPGKCSLYFFNQSGGFGQLNFLTGVIRLDGRLVANFSGYGPSGWGISREVFSRVLTRPGSHKIARTNPDTLTIASRPPLKEVPLSLRCKSGDVLFIGPVNRKLGRGLTAQERFDGVVRAMQLTDPDSIKPKLSEYSMLILEL